MLKVENPFLKDEVKREFIGYCPYCNEEPVYKVYLKNGVVYQTENCQCMERVRFEEEYKHMSEDITPIVLMNKEDSNLSANDRDELNNIHFDTHKGNIHAYNTMIDYANRFNKEMSLGFYLYGKTGTGKSFLAKKTMAVVLNRGFSAYITNPIELNSNIRKDLSEYKNDTIAKCQDVDLLVIDDLGVEKPSDFDKQNMFTIIESRHSQKKPIIFTSNCSLDEIKMKYDEYGRIHSRIMGTTKALEISGKDYRKIKG